MNRTLLARFAIVSAVFVFLGAGYESGHSGSSGHPSGHAAQAPHTPRPRVVIKMHRVTVPQPQRIAQPQHIVRDNRQINYPRTYETGARITQRSAVIPPQHHVEIMRNHALVQNITQRERSEVTPNRYYWHNDGKVRYAHYYDSYGVHWYGFYHGPSFYWTRYWGNRWWWYDPHFLRWVYWNNGYWWWPSPTGTVYVYAENNYYPYEPGGVVTVVNPEVQTAPAEAPASPSAGHVITSPDASRIVQLDPQGNAYLYDYSTGQQVYMKFLGQGVSTVKYSGGKDGKPLQILVEFKDGSFAMYDSEGSPMDAPSVSADDTPGAPPSAIPPTPDPSQVPAASAPAAPNSAPAQ